MRRRIGVDLAMRSSHTAVVVDESGNASRATSIDVSLEGFQKLRDLSFNGSDGCPSPVVMEPTGNVWLPVAAYMTMVGAPVVISSTRKASDFRKVLRRHVKSDPTDAESLARLTLFDPARNHVFQMPSVDLLSLRRMVKRRDRFVRRATASKLRIHAALQLTNPLLMECFGEEKFTTPARVMLRDFVDPFSVVKLGEKRFRQRLREKTRCDPEELAHEIFVVCEKVCALYSELIQKKALPFSYELMAQEIGEELDEIERAEARIQQLDRSIKQLYARVDPARTLQQIPGMGDTIAPAIEALSSPLIRFRHAGAYASYTGLVPRMSQSGISPHDRSHHITKSGNRLLKKYYHLAAETARRVDPELAAFYSARSAQKWHHGRIITAIAHKLVRRVHALLRRREAHAQLPPNSETHAPRPYELRTPDGHIVDRKAARAYILEHYPSKREQARRASNHAKDKRDASQLVNAGQPKGSTKRVKRDHVPPPTISQLSLDNERYAQCVNMRVENRCKSGAKQSPFTCQNDLDTP